MTTPLSVRELRQKLFQAPGGFLVGTVSGQGQAPTFDECTGVYLITHENEHGEVAITSVVVTIDGRTEVL